MSILVECKCGKRYSVKTELAGRRLQCRKCGRAIAIPVAVAAPAALTVPAAVGTPAANDGPQLDELANALRGEPLSEAPRHAGRGRKVLPQAPTASRARGWSRIAAASMGMAVATLLIFTGAVGAYYLEFVPRTEEVFIAVPVAGGLVIFLGAWFYFGVASAPRRRTIVSTWVACAILWIVVENILLLRIVYPMRILDEMRKQMAEDNRILGAVTTSRSLSEMRATFEIRSKSTTRTIGHGTLQYHPGIHLIFFPIVPTRTEFSYRFDENR